MKISKMKKVTSNWGCNLFLKSRRPLLLYEKIKKLMETQFYVNTASYWLSAENDNFEIQNIQKESTFYHVFQTYCHKVCPQFSYTLIPVSHTFFEHRSGRPLRMFPWTTALLAKEFLSIISQNWHLLSHDVL